MTIFPSPSSRVALWSTALAIVVMPGCSCNRDNSPKATEQAAPPAKPASSAGKPTETPSTGEAKGAQRPDNNNTDGGRSTGSSSSDSAAEKQNAPAGSSPSSTSGTGGSPGKAGSPASPGTQPAPASSGTALPGSILTTIQNAFSGENAPAASELSAAEAHEIAVKSLSQAKSALEAGKAPQAAGFALRAHELLSQHPNDPACVDLLKTVQAELPRYARAANDRKIPDSKPTFITAP